MDPVPEESPQVPGAPQSGAAAAPQSTTATMVRRSRRPPDRPAPPKTAEAEPLPSRAGIVAGVAVIVLLCAVCLGLAFQGGAYSPADWLPFLVGVAALALVVSISGPEVLTGRYQRVLLAIFGLQAVWTAASIFWATSLGNAWEEINRTFFYAVGIALAFAAVRWAGRVGLDALTALLTAVIGAAAVVIVVRLAVSGDPSIYFAGGRLNYPVTYFNGLACLLMMGFWLALGMANGPMVARLRRREAGEAPTAGAGPQVAGGALEGGHANTAVAHADAPTAGATRRAARPSLGRAGLRGGGRGGLPRWAQPILLVLAVFLLELALLPQSRGGFWTFFLVIPFFVILSPSRFRALFDLGIVALPMVLFWGRLNDVYVAIRDDAPLDAALGSALRAMGYSVLIVLGAWTVSWLVERLTGPLAGRVRVAIGIALVVLAIGGAAAGLIYADHRTGDLGGYLGDRWEEFTSDKVGETGSGGRFAAVGLNGRLTQWKVSAKASEQHPMLGVGAQNFEIYWYQHRTTLLEVRQPHSQPMQVLGELGLPGLVLYVAFALLVLVRAVVVRFRTRGRATQAVVAAMMTAVLCWFIHSSADWLWQLAAVALPAMLLFGGLIGAGPTAGARARSRAATAEATVPAAAARETGTSAAEFLAASRMDARRGARGARRRWVYRAILAVLALAVIVSAALPYLSMRYSDMAAGSTDLQLMTDRAATAAALDPTSVTPLATRAGAHRAAAAQGEPGSAEQIEQLNLAAQAWVEATEREPGGWLYYYQAAEAYLAARDAALAAGTFSKAEEFGDSARSYLDEAGRLNPLSPQVKALEKAF
ncbi:MAG: O-antigen ligase family protein [Thermoleophilia bacterium]|nr:O-antigen ligase family protein [Thermoleophilia bacterium]